jgi:hypothetical protein
MPDKPIVLLEAWQLLKLNNQPYQLWGYASHHPSLPGYRRLISTSRVLRLDDQQREAETLNTRYRLRYPIDQVIFDGAYPLGALIAGLAAEREDATGTWCVRCGTVVLANNLASMNTAILALLAILDRQGTNGPT